MTQRHRLPGWLLAGFVIICLAKAAFALDPKRTISQYVHDHWGADRGFVGGEIYAISQSNDGYLWIGTERGLVRFDGYTFTMVHQPLPDAPPVDRVRGLLSDGEGNLWIRLEGPHMLLYRDGKFEDVGARLDLQDVTITAMAVDNEGAVLLAGLGDRTLRYRNGHLETVVKTEEQPGTVISMAVTRDGRIWMGTQYDGLSRVSHGQISRLVEESDASQVKALLPAVNGALWIGTERGLQHWDGKSLTKEELPTPIGQLQILAMARDRRGNVWIGTNHGIVRISISGAVSVDQLRAGPGNEVTAIFEDRDGSLWFGGPQGIERLRDGMFSSFSTAQGLASDRNGPVYVDSDGRTWFAPLSGGLYWMRDGRIAPITLGGLDHDVVYSISGGKDEVWVGRQSGGLTVLTGHDDSFSGRTYTHADGLAQDSVYSVHRSRDGTVWAGTVSAGVSRLADGRFTNFSEANGLSSNTVNSIAEGFDGTIWLATPGGLNSFADGHWTNRSAQDGLPASNVRTIFEDSKHVLWIATSGGLAFLSSGHIRVPQKLPEGLREQIYGIAEDGMGSLWFTTSDHVFQVNRDRLLKGSLGVTDIQSYGISDGLPGVEGVGRDRTIVPDQSGRIWVSLDRGLAVADPRVAIDNAVPGTVRIESMSAGGDQLDLQNPPRLPAGVESIVFNYAGGNLAAPERIRFRYKLDGSDRGWSDVVASRQVTYTNLGPGSYRFRVVASNSNGLWNGPETTVPFIIEPAFWQTWWFRLVCVAAVVLMIVALYRLRMYQMTRRLNVRFQERLAERTRIAQDLHDTLLQGVLSASLQLDVAEDQVPEDSPAKPLLRRVLQLMGKVTEEGRNALRGLRSSEADNRSLELAFSRVRQEFTLDDKIGYRVIANNIARPVRPIIRDEVYRIGREALVNAFVHAQANNIEVEVEYASRHLRVLVRDDGSGIDPQVLQSGRDGHWGLSGMRERSEGIGANLKLRSRIGAGTEVELTVPSTIAFESESRGPISQWLPWLSREKFEGSANDKTKRVDK
jgi:ligand-binding sensor domain-containing protein/signal transduction histidine kinase